MINGGANKGVAGEKSPRGAASSNRWRCKSPSQAERRGNHQSQSDESASSKECSNCVTLRWTSVIA